MSFLDDYADCWTPEPNTGCYLWLGWNVEGYGGVHIKGKNKRVSRLVLEEAVGPPPTSKHYASHNTPNGCCGPECINPAHLRWATQSQNMLDLPAEKRREISRIARAAIDWKEQKKAVRKANALRSPEQLRVSAQKAHAALTPEQRRERALKIWVTRRSKTL